MKKLSIIVICFSLFAISSPTKFVLLGSLGDLAKKYLWSALHQLHIEDVDQNIEIFGASRNAPEQGTELLDEVLQTIVGADTKPVLKDLEEKVVSFFQELPETSSKILADGQEKFNEVLENFPETSSKILADGQEKFNEVLDNLPKTSQTVQDKLTSFFSNLPEKSTKMLSDGKDKLAQLLDKVPEARENLVKFVNNLPENSHILLAEGQEKLSKIYSNIFEVKTPFAFRDNVKYLQLKKEEHFAEFCADVTDELLIFYLSIPPSAYISTTEMIAKHCKKTGVIVRVAYEKPFGYDSQSAKTLFSSLETLVEKDNIYLIDHYLGKSITQQIIPLRRSNAELESMLNKEHVSSIQVNLLETVDCKGRTSYYDESGVIRDMLQNHATEILLLITSDLSDDLPGAKADMLRSLSQPNKHQVVVAQYERYQTHVGVESTTPTFASVMFLSNSKRWADVPIVMTSGKSQAVERKNIIVTFKSGGNLTVSFKPATVTFNGADILPADFAANSNSYITLIGAVIEGHKDLLPSVDTVLVSWGLWDSVINMPHNMALHANHGDMKVERHGKFLIVANTVNPHESERIKYLKGNFLVTDHEEHLYEQVAEDIIKVITNTLKIERQAHVALSGGKSVLGVYKYLIARSAKTAVPWNKVHIWQVDERCDPGYRNSKELEYYLLKDIDISPGNVHYMTVGEAGCEAGDAEEYQRIFENYNTDAKFNYVLLGMGTDGHTASLFPRSEIISQAGDIIHLLAETSVSPERITITFDLINEADWVSILVVGAGKLDIIKAIRQGETAFPVAKVYNDRLTWYIDEVLN